MRSINLQSFLLIPLVVLELCPGQDVVRQTDIRTDKPATIRSPFGEHIKLIRVKDPKNRQTSDTSQLYFYRYKQCIKIQVS